VARPILKDGLYGKLREGIIAGVIPPGAVLPQERFSKEFNVSRTPLQETSRQLVYEGFAEHVPHCGARVVVSTRELVREVLVVREALEGIAAREAASRTDRTQLAALRRRFDELRIAVLHSDLAEVGDEIHQTLFDSCGNKQLSRLIEVYWGKVEWFQRLASKIPRRRSRAFFEHDGILRALEARDPVWAENEARAHIRNTLRELLGSFVQTEASPSKGGKRKAEAAHDATAKSGRDEIQAQVT